MMTETECEDFVFTLRESNKRLSRIEADLTDCLIYCMRHVNEYNNSSRWFGSIAGGTIYIDSEDWVWLPNTQPLEAKTTIEILMGKQLDD